MSAPVRRDYLGWAATVFALVVTFSAEYELAKAVGIHHVVALAVPGALDVYVLRALQVKRDVLLTVLAMIAVNAASHLVAARVLAVEWPLIVAVSAIAPLVLWRAHVLGGFRGTPEHEPEHVTPVEPEHAPVPEPDDWDVLARNFYDEHITPEPKTAAVLTLPVPAEPGTLLEGDREHIDRAREFFETSASTPALRALKRELGVGTDRARRIRDYLIKEEVSTP